MKNIFTKPLLVALLLLPVQTLFSQPTHTMLNRCTETQLMAMTFAGGAFGVGTIVKTNINGNDLKVLHNFNGADGANPYGTMVRGSDGLLYGTTTQGGTSIYPHGVVFKMNIDGTGYTVLHEFTNQTGDNPFTSLIQTTDGSLAGMTVAGGTSNDGTIFKMNTDGSGYTVLHSFDVANGFLPIGCALMQASDGTLFGMTTWGGSNQFGTIFRIQIDGTGFTVLRNLDGNPSGSLVQASDNSLFGMTPGSNTNGVGVIFRISPDGSNYTELFKFDNFNGRYPTGSLIIGPDHTLFGVTQAGGPGFENGAVQGGGTLFKINPDGTGHSILHNFVDSTGATPGGSVIIYQNKLFGYTTGGGKFHGGVFFSYNLATNVYTKLADLDETTGRYPQFGTLLLVNPDAVKQAKPFVSKFYIVDPESGHDIAVLKDEDHITTADVNIRVEASDLTSSVEFLLDDKKHSKDNTAPFTLFAEGNGDYKNDNLKCGSHKLTAIPFSKKNGKALQGEPLTIRFTVERFRSNVSVALFPNPVKGNASVEVNGIPNSKVCIQITNYNDKSMMTLYRGVLDKAGFVRYSFSPVDTKSGTYILIVRINDDVFQKRFIIE